MAKFLGPNLDINTNPGGDEGGELHLAAPTTGTTLSGNVNIDVYQNKLRIFESGVSNRGAYIDLSAASTGVGSNLLAGGGGATVSDTAPTSPTDGQVWFDSTTGKSYIYYDSFWVEVGTSSTVLPTLDDLTDVTISAPTSGQLVSYNGSSWVNTANNNGLVYIASKSFSADSAPFIDNVFTTAYQNYCVVINFTSTGNNQLLWKFRSGSVDTSVSAYYWGGWYLNMTGTAALTPENGGGGVAGGRIGVTGTNGTFLHTVQVASPKESQVTTWTAQPQGAEAYSRYYSGYWNGTDQFDGFKIYVGSGTMTGVMTVYGYKK